MIDVALHGGQVLGFPSGGPIHFSVQKNAGNLEFLHVPFSLNKRHEIQLDILGPEKKYKLSWTYHRDRPSNYEGDRVIQGPVHTSPPWYSWIIEEKNLGQTLRLYINRPGKYLIRRFEVNI